jgi:hypothetical protein
MDASRFPASDEGKPKGQGGEHEAQIVPGGGEQCIDGVTSLAPTGSSGPAFRRSSYGRWWPQWPIYRCKVVAAIALVDVEINLRRRVPRVAGEPKWITPTRIRLGDKERADRLEKVAPASTHERGAPARGPTPPTPFVRQGPPERARMDA